MTKEHNRIPDWYRVEPYFGCESLRGQENEETTVEVELTNSNCNTFADERSRSDWKRIRDSYLNHEPRCGHAIDYLVRNADSKISIETAKDQSGYMARFVEFLYNRDKCVSSAELADVDRFFVELCWIDITDSTFLTYRKNICNLFHHIELYREEEAETSRALIIDAIDPSDYETEEGFERRALTAKQLKKFLNAVTSRRNLLIIRIAVEVGPRNRDIAKLKIDDVDLENQRVNITNTKSGGNYSGYIPSELTMLLRRWIEIERPSLGVEDSNEYLFPSQKGGRLGVNQIGRIVHKAADRAGIQREIDKIPLSERQKEIWGTDKDYRSVYRVDVHTLRHTFNELLAKSGVSREARSFALDHSTTEVTKEHYDEARERHWNEIEEKFSGLPDFID